MPICICIARAVWWRIRVAGVGRRGCPVRGGAGIGRPCRPESRLPPADAHNSAIILRKFSEKTSIASRMGWLHNNCQQELNRNRSSSRQLNPFFFSLLSLPGGDPAGVLFCPASLCTALPRRDWHAPAGGSWLAQRDPGPRAACGDVGAAAGSMACDMRFANPGWCDAHHGRSDARGAVADVYWAV